MVIESGSPLQHIRLIQLIPNRDRTTSLSNSIRPISKVTEETAGVVERWFESERDAEVWGGELGCGRRGWHGQGWLGNGNWRVTRMQMDEMGVCLSCGEKLVSIDIDPKETENFTASLTNLVRQREVEADFMQFQGWGLRQQSATNGCQGVASVT
ncbi:unnamed protein product [Camellia sinensis]